MSALQGAASGAAAGASFGPIGAGIGAGIGLASGIFGSHASHKAAQQQQEAAERARRAREQYYAQIQGMLDPYRRAGQGALPALSALAGGSTGYQGHSVLRGVQSAQQNPNPPSWAQAPPVTPEQLSAPPARTMDQGMSLGQGMSLRPGEDQYVENWQQQNPTAQFTDADLHGYRNNQVLSSVFGLTDAQLKALSPADQKRMLAQAKVMGRGKGL